MDFFQIKEKTSKSGVLELYPDFKVCRSKDLMVRGRSFYGIWHEERNLWSTDEYDVQDLVDKALYKHKEELQSKTHATIQVKAMSDFSSNSWSDFRKYMNHISDNSHQLDQQLTFMNTEIKKKDYVSKRLPYSLVEGEISAYDELIGTLYEPDERAKLEWAIGSIISGDSKNIQKFIVLYGDAGAGKSTILNIVQKLFEGYYTTFEAKALTLSNNAFATEVFRDNPLVAIQHDGDLSKIEDNSKLNSIISHEDMTMNEKYKPSYTSRINAFLFMATNKPVKITDAKSGIIRRLIDVKPSGNKVPTKKYHSLVSQIDFELGAIANHCLEVYRDMGKNYYSNYKPIEMMLQTDVFFNYIENYYFLLKEQDGVTLTQAYDLYKEYADEALLEYKLPKHRFREELKNYFHKFHEMTRIGEKQVRNYYSGFLHKKIDTQEPDREISLNLDLDYEVSILDDICKDCQAQLANAKHTPSYAWDNVTTTLKDIDTSKVHYVRLQENHIVIDFDLKDSEGKKSLFLNLQAASTWPPTYTEISKGGSGLHLHYFYEGDVELLEGLYSEGIEILTSTGKSALRRRLSKCNNIEIKVLHGGLPLKGEKKTVINETTFNTEKSLRNIIEKNLRKEIHGSTKSSMDFMRKILDDAYNSGVVYDLTDLKSRVMIFANNSTNQAHECIKMFKTLKFKSEEQSVNIEAYKSDDLYFFDVEVFPNLFVLVYKKEGPGEIPRALVNAPASQIEDLFDKKLIGFNCRRYDNHILYGRYIGHDLDDLYKLSQNLVNNKKSVTFREAYNLSYTDIYDFSSEKKSLKKFEVDLGIQHMELGLPWDQPVDESLWDKVVEYCINDVIATEAVFFSKNIQADYVARQILSDLSGLTMNDSTLAHTARIMFGDEKNPQQYFNYPDLSEEFPGYKYSYGVSTYRGETIGEGGVVRAELGYYEDVPVLDVKSMHPNSLINMNHFGKYTQRFAQLVQARIAIKDKDFDVARTLLDGMLAKYLVDTSLASKLAYSLKIVINIVYGFTSAKFPNPFKDPRNVDNVVAKRGALFMIDLMYAVREQGFTVAHIKTDSIKIPNGTPEIIQFVMDFGKKYGYTFEHEKTYDKLLLVNKSTFIAKVGKEWLEGDYTIEDVWSAVGDQFAFPYVYKTLFTKQPLVFEDFCITNSVTTAMYMKYDDAPIEDYVFVGKVGNFCPVTRGGATLLRKKDEEHYDSVNGTKGYKWELAEIVKQSDDANIIDYSYFEKFAEEAKKDINKYTNFEEFVSESIPTFDDKLPWEE